MPYGAVKYLNNYWVVIFPNKNKYYHVPAQWSLAFLRKESISLFLEGSTLRWDACKKLGYECIKVNVRFEIV